MAHPAKVELCLFKAIRHRCAMETGSWWGVEVFLLIECHHSQPDEFVNVNRSLCPIRSSVKYEKDQPSQWQKMSRRPSYLNGSLHLNPHPPPPGWNTLPIAFFFVSGEIKTNFSMDFWKTIWNCTVCLPQSTQTQNNCNQFPGMKMTQSAFILLSSFICWCNLWFQA